MLPAERFAFVFIFGSLQRFEPDGVVLLADSPPVTRASVQGEHEDAIQPSTRNSEELHPFG